MQNVRLSGQVITGRTASSDQVTVRLTGLAVLPQASVTFQVLVCDLVQFPVTGLSEKDGVPTEQLSDAVAEPKASFI
jgi:hypothetical protein